MRRAKGPTPCFVRSWRKYAVRPRTTTAKTNCAARKMMERRRVKIIVLGIGPDQGDQGVLELIAAGCSAVWRR